MIEFAWQHSHDLQHSKRVDQEQQTDQLSRGSNSRFDLMTVLVEQQVREEAE
jgi:hypothetical protein